jgi:hypothetical protein
MDLIGNQRLSKSPGMDQGRGYEEITAVHDKGVA